MVKRTRSLAIALALSSAIPAVVMTANVDRAVAAQSCQVISPAIAAKGCVPRMWTQYICIGGKLSFCRMNRRANCSIDRCCAPGKQPCRRR